MAAFALAIICEGHPKGQALAAGSNLLSVCISHFGAAWQVRCAAQARPRPASTLRSGAENRTCGCDRASVAAPGLTLCGGHTGPSSTPAPLSQAASAGSPLLLKWICLCMGLLWDGMREVSAIAITQGVSGMLLSMLHASAAEVRACAVFALGTLIRTPAPRNAGDASAAAASAQPISR